MNKLILASSSPRRKKILQELGAEFVVVPSNFKEDNSRDIEHSKLAILHSKGKAEEVATRVDGIVIGVDTFVSLDGEILGKPKDETDAKDMLRKQSKREILVISGITIIDGEKEVSGNEKTLVKIKEISDSEIERYVRSGEPLDKAGAFGVQGFGAVLVEKIDGDFFNVVGMPLFRIDSLLRELGYSLWDFIKDLS